MRKVGYILVWLVITMWLTTEALAMVSAPNTVENVVGLALLVTLVAVSIQTKCFTNIKTLWKK